MDYLFQLMIGVWAVSGFVGYLALTETERVIAHRGRPSLGNALVLLSTIAGPITFVLYPLLKPKGPCPNIRCRRIYPLALPGCPYCGVKKSDLFPTPAKIREVRVPACLSSFLFTVANTNESDDAESSVVIRLTFHLKCSCGNKYGHVLGHQEFSPSGDSLFVGPLAFECSACGKVTEIFDESIHGYDAAQGEIKELRREREGRIRFKVPSGKPLAIAATFQYTNGLDIRVPGSDEHPEDYFDWFSLEGRPQGASNAIHIADFECA